MARQWTKTSGAAYYELKSSAAAQPEGADPVRCVLVVYRRKGMDEAYRHDLAAGLGPTGVVSRAAGGRIVGA